MSEGQSQSQGQSEGQSEGQSQSQSEGQSQSQSQSQSHSQSQGSDDGGGFGAASPPPLGRTGGGMAGGRGFVGGYGQVHRSAYATPASLGMKPWSQDFLLEGGQRAFPVDWKLNPYAFNPPLQWLTEDWDPGLRIWALPMFDPQLTEWLQDADLASPSSMVGREFAQQHGQWQHAGTSLDAQITTLVDKHWLNQTDVAWTGWKPGQATGSPNAKADGWIAIRTELNDLEMQMFDSRARYVTEALAQSDGVGPYFMHLLGADSRSKPWTQQLFQCAVAVSNITYMYFKGRFKRVRPSRLCPGLLPPFGPPQHPAFPSGHAMLGYFAALLLLEVPGIRAFHGVGIADGKPGQRPSWDRDYQGPGPLQGSLLWLAARLAKNRERVGLHYESDSSAGRHLAGGIWNAIFNDKSIVLPTLKRVLERASAEWPIDPQLVLPAPPPAPPAPPPAPPAA